MLKTIFFRLIIFCSIILV